jgi:hypothetical protein
LCILLHFQTRLCIFLHILGKIVYFPSYFREDCVFSFIFREDCVFSFIFQTRLCILFHISDKIVYFASYFRQDCIFGVCPVDFNCDAGYTYCHWCIFDLHEKWVKYQIIYLCSQCLYRIYHHCTCEFETTLCDQVYQWLIPGTVSLTVYYRYNHYNNLNLPPRCSWHIVKNNHYPENHCHDYCIPDTLIAMTYVQLSINTW